MNMTSPSEFPEMKDAAEGDASSRSLRTRIDTLIRETPQCNSVRTLIRWFKAASEIDDVVASSIVQTLEDVENENPDLPESFLTWLTQMGTLEPRERVACYLNPGKKVAPVNATAGTRKHGVASASKKTGPDKKASNPPHPHASEIAVHQNDIPPKGEQEIIDTLKKNFEALDATGLDGPIHSIFVRCILLMTRIEKRGTEWKDLARLYHEILWLSELKIDEISAILQKSGIQNEWSTSERIADLIKIAERLTPRTFKRISTFSTALKLATKQDK